MQFIYGKTLLLTLLITPSCFAADQNSRDVSQHATQVLHNLGGWNNQLIKQQLILRIKDNQHLIGFLAEHNLGKDDKEIDEPFQIYVNSLLEDQKSLAFIASNLLSISESEKLNLDKALARMPLFYQRLESKMNENLKQKSSEILVYRMLYFSLMEKYAVR